MRAMLLVFCALTAFAAQAQIYKKVLPDGSVVFTDEPSLDAEPIQVQPLPTYKAPPSEPKAQDAPAASPEPVTNQPVVYKRFAIETPAHDATIRDNSGNVTVTLALEPALATDQGHTLSLLLDGNLVAQGGTATSVNLQAVDRGSHTLEALLVDLQGKTLRRTAPVLFHLMRHSAR